MCKKHLNFTRKDFLESTAKEIFLLFEELNNFIDEESEDEEPIEKVVSIDNFPFL